MEKSIYAVHGFWVSVLGFVENVKAPQEVSWLEQLVVRFDNAWASDGLPFVVAALPGKASHLLLGQYPGRGPSSASAGPGYGNIFRFIFVK